MATKSILPLVDKEQQDWRSYDEPSKVLKFLTYCAETHTSCQVQLGAHNLELKTHIIESRKPRQFVTIQIPDPFDRPVWEKIFEENEVVRCNFILYLKAGAVLAFNAVLKSIEKDEMIFAVPQKVFKIQRRKNVRYEIPAGFNIMVEMNDPKVEHDTIKRVIFDISVGGLSFIITGAEKKFYQSGLFLPKLKMILRNRPLNLSGQVKNVFEISSKQGYKVGVSFHGLSNSDREFISSYVLSHHVQYLTDLEFRIDILQ